MNVSVQRWETHAILQLHRAVKLLGLLCNLLANPESNMLTRLIVKEPPAGVHPMEFLMQNSQDLTFQPFLLLIGVLDNCAAPFPKSAHLAAPALSLLVSRRPAVALSMLDPNTLSSAIYKYIGESIFGLVNNSECLVEQHFGVVALLNLLPLLYFLGDWKEAHEALPRYRLPCSLATTFINILHAAADDDAWDSPPDLNLLPELGGAHVWVRSLFQSNEMAGTVLRERPMSFAVAASIEVLGRWVTRQVPVSVDSIPVM